MWYIDKILLFFLNIKILIIIIFIYIIWKPTLEAYKWIIPLKQCHFYKNFFIDNHRKCLASSSKDLKDKGNLNDYINELNSNLIYHYTIKMYNYSVYNWSVENLKNNKYIPIIYINSLLDITRFIDKS